MHTMQVQAITLSCSTT